MTQILVEYYKSVHQRGLINFNKFIEHYHFNFKKFIEHHHFKIENLNSFLPLIQPGIFDKH